MQHFWELSPIYQALISGIITWLITALGACMVFFIKEFNRSIHTAVLSFSGGVMIAASFFSLIAPAINYARELNMIESIPIISGFILGCLFLYIIGKFVNKINRNNDKHSLLLLAMTLHNIPEGLAIGVAYGSIVNQDPFMCASALALAIGIGIQNFPEGSAVSMPLVKNGMSKIKAFNLGQLSAFVEPFSALIGACITMVVKPLMPYALAFAAGAMIYVVVDELLPKAVENNREGILTFSFLAGFVIMMLLDISL